MKILVINCGSSSIKYQLLDMQEDKQYSLLAKGVVEKINLEGSKLIHKPTGKTPSIIEKEIPNHTVGMKLLLDTLTDSQIGVISDFREIDAVGHRIVQGADFFDGSVLINESVMEKIGICCDFAPLHNPAHILGIRAMQEVLPDVPQAVVFDTAFHQTMEPAAYMYALPYEYYEKYRVRRYGAHGTSHYYVSRKGAEFAGLDINNSKIITCHIGNGSSVTAVKNGKSIDTTMGFTPLEGMIMGTRCGTIDANIVPYIMKKEGLTPDEMTDIMNKKSGFIGLNGKSSDMRDMIEAAEQGDAKSKLAIDKLVHDIVKQVGGFVAEMNGVDLIVFTAGIGEHNPWLIFDICKHFSYIGLKLDDSKTEETFEDTMLSAANSTVKVAMIPTNEELMIAIDTMRLAKEAKK